MPELKINGNQLNLGNNKIALTKNFYALEDPFSRRLTTSNEIEVNDAAKHSSIFNRPDNMEVSGDKFNIYYPFTYEDVSNVLLKGNAVLKSANSSYKLQLLDSSKEFVQNLNENLNKLDFESDDFVFSLAEYELKKFKANGSIWVWAAVAMHEKRIQSKTILAGGAANDKLKFSRPQFLLSAIRTKIAEQTGWDIIGCDTLDIVSNICLSSNAKAFYVTSYQKQMTGSFAIAGTYYFDNLDINLDFSKTGTGEVDFPDSQTIRIENYSTAFRFRGNITSDSDMIIQFKGISKNNTEEQLFEFVINSGTDFYDIETSLFETDETYYDINVILVGTGNVTFHDTLLYTKIEEGALGDFKDNNLLDYYVKVYDNLPDFTQLDIIKNCWAMFGSFHYSDNFRKLINVRAVQDVGVASSLDWSTKLDTDDTTWTISNNFGSFGKTNYFKYDNDDTISEVTGRGSFTINNETLADIYTWYTNLFSASVDVVIEDVTMADFNIYSDTERVNTINDRILYIEESLEDYATNAIFSKLSGDVLLTSFYKNAINAFKDIQVLDCYINLSRLDFFSFNGIRSVFLDYFKSTFLVIEISNYIEGRETNVKLLKLA